ncbi:uncharacterized protein LOC134259055 [Saccostrea cucullata]|uniref:uncharacterized protein LOC134259055 n=1 Tax=Saccostrea cuccullata TaxID=36930 RepID=UPI002ED45ACB
MRSSRLSTSLYTYLLGGGFKSSLKKVFLLSLLFAIIVWIYSFVRLSAVYHDHCLHWSETSDIRIPQDELLHQVSPYNLSCLYQRYVTSLQSLCTEPKRFGNVDYGGVRICTDGGVAPSLNCVVYSYNHDLSDRFVEQIHAKYRCNVVFYGDEMEPRKNTHLLRFNKILYNYERKLSVVILKIKSSDFPFLLDFCKSVRVASIKQIILEIHYDTKKENPEDYIMLLTALRELHSSNYVIYWYDRNWEYVENSRTKQRKSKCFTINMFLTNRNTSSSSQHESNMISPKINLPDIAPLGIRPLGREEDLKYEKMFNDYITKHQILCKQMIRLGNIVDGGWDVCHDIRFRPKTPCIVYSFGISNDFSFDEDMEKTYGCDVFSFDPSMNVGNYKHSEHIMFYQVGLGDKVSEIEVKGIKWKIKNLKTIIKELGHTEKKIDVLKIDIEGSERQILPEIIESGALKNVVQLCLEFHNYTDVGALRKLYELGFRIYWAHQNPTAPTYKSNETFAYYIDVYFVNINFK